MCTQYSPNQYTNKAVCILLGDYDVQKNLPFSIIMTVTKTIQSSHHISFKHSHLHYPPQSPTSFLLFRFHYANFVFPSYLLYACYMPHVYYLPCYNYVNIWWTVTDMKLTTESSAPLYSYLPLTSNILLTTLLSQTLSLFFSCCKTPNFTPTQNDSNNVSSTAQYMQHSELNSNKYCLNLSCSFSQDHGPSQILSVFNIS